MGFYFNMMVIKWHKTAKILFRLTFLLLILKIFTWPLIQAYYIFFLTLLPIRICLTVKMENDVYCLSIYLFIYGMYYKEKYNYVNAICFFTSFIMIYPWGIVVADILVWINGTKNYSTNKSNIKGSKYNNN